MAHRHRHRKPGGRPKKTGPRTPSGQQSRAYATIARDFGTLELQDKRRTLVGENADPDLSASAVGILKAHGHLDAEQAEKAWLYATLCTAVYGPWWVKNGDGREITDDQASRNERHLNTMIAKLTTIQKYYVDLTTRTTNWQPTWFHRLRAGKPLTDEDEFERNALLSGLDALLDRKSPTAHAA